jgi:AcrR family transcriptional regulator
MAEIVRVAAKVFQDRGFHDATLEEVANSLQISKGGLYYYVRSKDELLYEIHRMAMDLVLPRLAEIASRPGISAVQKLELAVQNHITNLTDEFDVVVVMLQQEYALAPYDRQAIAALRNRYDDFIIGIIEEGKQNGEFRADVNARMAVYHLLGSLNWIPHWYQRAGSMTLGEISTTFVQFFLDGISTANRPSTSD